MHKQEHQEIDVQILLHATSGKMRVLTSDLHAVEIFVKHTTITHMTNVSARVMYSKRLRMSRKYPYNMKHGHHGEMRKHV